MYGVVWSKIVWEGWQLYVGYALYDSESEAVTNGGQADMDQFLPVELAAGESGFVALMTFRGTYGGPDPVMALPLGEAMDTLGEVVLLEATTPSRPDLTATDAGYALAYTGGDFVGAVRTLNASLEPVGADIPLTPAEQPARLELVSAPSTETLALATSGFYEGVWLYVVDVQSPSEFYGVDVDTGGPFLTLTGLSALPSGSTFLVAWSELPTLTAPPATFAVARVDGTSLGWEVRWEGVAANAAYQGPVLPPAPGSGPVLVLWGEVDGSSRRFFASLLDVELGLLGEAFEPFPGTELHGQPDMTTRGEGSELEYGVAFVHGAPTTDPTLGDERWGGEVHLGRIRCTEPGGR